VNKPLFVTAVAIATLAVSNAGGQSDPWVGLRFLKGKWEGKANGEPGKGVSSREYRFDLNGRFLSAPTGGSTNPSRLATNPKCTRISRCTVMTGC
jgi:hypothetical protein